MSDGFPALMGIVPTSIDGRAAAAIAPGEPAMGRPGAMHGGATATLLEQAGRAALVEAMGGAAGADIMLASMTVDYLRVGPMAPSRALGTIVKAGGRVAVVSASAWADDPAKPYASAKLTFLVSR